MVVLLVKWEKARAMRRCTETFLWVKEIGATGRVSVTGKEAHNPSTELLKPGIAKLNPFSELKIGGQEFSSLPGPRGSLQGAAWLRHDGISQGCGWLVCP